MRCEAIVRHSLASDGNRNGQRCRRRAQFVVEGRHLCHQHRDMLPFGDRELTDMVALLDYTKPDLEAELKALRDIAKALIARRKK
jgi:hypothetical protein